MSRLLLGVLAPFLLSSQPATQAVVIGRVEPGTETTVNGRNFVCSGRVTVVRPVTGPFAAGDTVSISWEYRPIPGQTPQSVAQFSATGILNLQQTGPARWQAQVVAVRSPDSAGGIVLPVPVTPLAADLAYAPAAPPDARLAVELAAFLRSWLPRIDEDHTPAQYAKDAQGGWGLTANAAQAQFLQAAEWLFRLEPAQTAPVYRTLFRSGSPNLRAIGVAGLLGAADPDAFALLEREAPVLGRTLTAKSFGSSLRRIPPASLAGVLPALGAILLSETGLPNFDVSAMLALGNSRDPRALPYLAAMLDAPHNETRVWAVSGLCSVLRGARLWQPEMAASCPNSVPLQDPTAEPAYTRYWRDWYAHEEAALRTQFQLARVHLPARFLIASTRDVYEPPVVMEARFNVFIHSLLNSLQTRPDPFAGRLSGADEEKVIAIVTRIDGELRRMRQDLMGAFEKGGAFPTRAAVDLAEQARRAKLRDGLDQLQRELSAAGWSLIERDMLGYAISVSPPGAIGAWW